MPWMIIRVSIWETQKSIQCLLFWGELKLGYNIIYLQGPIFSKVPESCSKFPILTITELFYSHILNMNWGSFHTRSFGSKHLSGFRFRLTKKNCFAGRQSFRDVYLAIRGENVVWFGKLNDNLFFRNSAKKASLPRNFVVCSVCSCSCSNVSSTINYNHSWNKTTH